jgi:hypothetical protein
MEQPCWRDLEIGDELQSLSPDTRHWLVLWKTEQDLYLYGIHNNELINYSFYESDFNLALIFLYKIKKFFE